MAGSYLKLLEEARALRFSGADQSALVAYSSLLRIHPEASDAWAEYGSLLLSQNQVEGARTAYANSLAIDPNFLPALAGQGRVCLRLGQFEDAATHLERGLSVDPRQTELYLDLARCRWKQGELDQARIVLGAAVEQDPANLLITKFLIEVLVRQNNWPALHREMLRRAYLDYSGAALEWEACCVNLLFGVMPEGWDQHESRWNNPGLTNPKREFPQPLWDGSAFQGRTLLLHCEQGFGDTLMFVRYAPLVKALGGKVLLLAQPELVDLVATCPGVDLVIVEGSPIPPFDLHLPLMSLPRVFHTDLECIPAEIPYLDVPEQVPNREAIDALLAASRSPTRIGVSWCGNPSHARDAQRSIAPGALLPLRSLPAVAWFSFQHNVVEMPPLSGIASVAPLLSNFSDTAYALSGMDLLITVDTAMAHLAGALGIPTLLLVSFLPDWRWLMGRDDSPWYPTLRIYRQATFGDWEAPLRQMVADLTQDG